MIQACIESLGTARRPTCRQWIAVLCGLVGAASIDETHATSFLFSLLATICGVSAPSFLQAQSRLYIA